MGGGGADGARVVRDYTEFTKMNEFTGIINLLSGIQTRVMDKNLVDSLEGKVARDYDSMACP
jgi:hypothetical protein